jgi:hypothetical protein
LVQGGRLALLSNRVTPVSPTRQDLDEAYVGLLDVSQRQAIDAVHDDGLTAIVDVLLLEPRARAELRSRLEERIGAAGVDARKEGVAVIYTPPASA